MSTTAGESLGSEIMLFGVRLVVDSMRKSVSLNNLSQYVHPQDSPVTGSAGDKDVTVGYSSADEATTIHLHSSSNSAIAASRDRKQGVLWTKKEHKLFLLGLQKVGKGDWRGILRNFVKTQTPTHVASHSQKYFLHRSNLNHRCRRSSLFDITTDTIDLYPSLLHFGNDGATASCATSAPVFFQACSIVGCMCEPILLRLPASFKKSEQLNDDLSNGPSRERGVSSSEGYNALVDDCPLSIKWLCKEFGAPETNFTPDVFALTIADYGLQSTSRKI